MKSVPIRPLNGGALTTISVPAIIHAAIILTLMAFGCIFVETPAMAERLRLDYIPQSQFAKRCGGVGGIYNNGPNSYFCGFMDGSNYYCDKKTKSCTQWLPAVAPHAGIGGSVKGGTSVITRGEAEIICNTGAGITGNFGCGVPCDPIFCKIYCRGEPTCTFGPEPIQAIRPKPPTNDAPVGSLSSFSGGAAPANPTGPAGVP